MATAKRVEPVTTLFVRPGPQGRFEVYDGSTQLGTSENESMALWSAVGFAEEMSKSGRKLRVVRVASGVEIEEWPEPDLADALEQ
jgi:hypothetical protein